MTSQGIIGSEVSTVVTNNVSRKSENVNSKTDSFSKVMEKNNYENQANQVYKNDKSDFHSSRSEVISHKHMHQINNNLSKQDTLPKGFVKEEFIADVETVINDIANAYKETLDLSDEELISIMEELAINIFQLPMQEFAKDIVVSANGENDITSLLVNENALMDLQSMNQFFDKYNSETTLDMSPNELSALVEEAINNLVAMTEDTITTQDIQGQEIQLNSQSKVDTVVNNTMSITDNLDIDSLQNTNDIKHVEAIDIGDGKVINIEIVDIRQNMTKDNNFGIDMIPASNHTIDLNKETIQDKGVNLESFNHNYLSKDDVKEVLEENIIDTKLSSKTSLESDELMQDEVINLKDTNADTVKEKLVFDKVVDRTQDATSVIRPNNETKAETNIADVLDASVEDVTDVDASDLGLEDTTDMEDNFEIKETKKENFEIHIEESNDTLESNTENNETFEDNSSNDFVNDESKTFYDKFITNLEKSFGIDEGSILKEVSHLKEMQEVVNQIIDKIKVHISKEATTMKLNLNPEHLGKVELEVTSKSGILTADFVVESETAKEALEKGLPTLLEKFHEQGLKVEAVEVSIADYDFTRQDGERKSKADYGQEDKKKKRNGKISLDDIAVTNEVVQEEKQIMSNMGIDYSV